GGFGRLGGVELNQESLVGRAVERATHRRSGAPSLGVGQDREILTQIRRIFEARRKHVATGISIAAPNAEINAVARGGRTAVGKDGVATEKDSGVARAIQGAQAVALAEC